MSTLRSDDNDHTEQAAGPPTDQERFVTLARLIEQRLTVLHTAQRSRSFTAAEARELVVLEALRRDWVLEGRRE